MKEDTPKSIGEGKLNLYGVDLNVHTLDNGKAVIEEGSLHELLKTLKDQGLLNEHEISPENMVEFFKEPEVTEGTLGPYKGHMAEWKYVDLKFKGKLMDPVRNLTFESESLEYLEEEFHYTVDEFIEIEDDVQRIDWAATLENWSFIGDQFKMVHYARLDEDWYGACGDVYNDRRGKFKEGTSIRTTVVTRLFLREDNSPYAFKTKSGTIYQLGKVDPAYEKFLKETDLKFGEPKRK